tara:strand:- start:429 stop:2072 length:1644 start_codon:yes stop_codon:yes gene_type:complete
MSDLRDFTGKNRKFTGTTGLKISSGTAAQRVNESGRFRFNTDVNLLEYYSGSEWKSIDSPPVINTIAVDGGSDATTGSVDNEASGNSTIVIKGSLFDTSAASVSFVGSGETLSPASTTINSSSQITVTLLKSSVDIGNSPYNVKVTNPSGLSGELGGALSADSTAPTFTNAVDTTVTLFDTTRAAGIPAADLCGASNSSNFSVTSGSLPGGLSMTTSTGAITGTATAVGTDTTSTFTVSAVGDDATSTRQFKITVKAPVRTTVTSTGGGIFTVPAGVTTLGLLMVAGGGSGGSDLGSGGGAGGMLEGTLTVVGGSNIPYNVGAGGAQSPVPSYHSGYYGANTTFGPIPGTGVTATATGGGYGCGHGGGSPKGSGSNPEQASSQINIGGTGGSGGGTGSADSSATAYRGGYGNQGDSGGLTGYGNDGGRGGGGSPPGNGAHGGGGGGGAGGVGEDCNTDGSGHSGDGGIGRVSTASGSPVYYAGGGGGSYYDPNSGAVGAAGQGGGTAGVTSGRSSAASANLGGGTGAGGHPGGGSGTGGSGIIIITH